jgi:DNA-directed RNA polymerase specialized sigma24 family protein
MSATARILQFTPADRSVISPDDAPEPVTLSRRGRHAQLTRRYVPALRRWMQGRLPRWAREAAPPESIDRAIGEALKGLEIFRGGYTIALQGALREAVIDRLSHARAVSRTNDPLPSPLERVMGHRSVERYEQALRELTETQRAAVVARIELGFGHGEVARMLALGSPSEARALTARALVQLARRMRDAG